MKLAEMRRTVLRWLPDEEGWFLITTSAEEPTRATRHGPFTTISNVETFLDEERRAGTKTDEKARIVEEGLQARFYAAARDWILAVDTDLHEKVDKTTSTDNSPSRHTALTSQAHKNIRRLFKRTERAAELWRIWTTT